MARYAGSSRWLVALISALIVFQAGAVAPAPVSAEDPAATSAPEMPTPSPTATPTADPSPAPAESPAPAPGESSAPAQTPPGVERVDMRTAASKTYEQADGSFVTELYSDAIFHQPEGSAEWQPIDLTFRPSVRDGALVAVEESPVRALLFPSATLNGFLRVEADGHSISLGVPADTLVGAPVSLPAIDPSGEFVDYADFLSGGIGLRVFPRADGFKTFFVVPSRPASNTFSLRIDAPGLSLAPDPERDQDLVFRDSAGQVVGRIPRPFMLDSSVLESVEGGRGGGLYSEAVTQVVAAQADGSYLLTLTVDEAFLDSAVYPVYVDPTTTTFPTGCSCTANDTFANSSTPNTNYNQYQRPDSPYYHEQWHGNTPGTSDYNELFIRFNDIAETLGSGLISDVSLQFYPYWQYNHSDWKSTWVERISETWGAGTLDWNNRPATDLAIGQFQTKEEVWADFRSAAMDAYVQDIVNGARPNHGLKLHAAELGQGGWKRIVSSNNSSLKPKLVVTWTAFAAPSVLYPNGGGETSSRTLNWSLPPSSTQSAFEVEVDTDQVWTTPPALTYSSGTVSGTAGTIPSHMIPAITSLTEGQTYYWRVRAKYGVNTAFSGWSTNGSFMYRQGATLGLPAHNTFESFDLGSGDQASVNVSTGNLVISHPIVSLPIRGGAFDLGLTYNSQALTNSGTGPGWRLNAMRRLTELGNGNVVLTAGDGSVHTFTKISTIGTVTTYTRPTTVYATLTKDTSWANEWKLVYRQQSVDEFNLSGSEGLLAKQADRHGNAISFAYYSGTNRLQTATDPAGRVVDFAWNTGVSPARLTTITDWAWVNSGVVQATQTGARRQYRLFYDVSGRLSGWSNPTNTSGTCGTFVSHLTCLEYGSNGLVTKIKKRLTPAAIVSNAIGTGTPLDLTSEIIYRGGEVAEFQDAAQDDSSLTGTTFSRTATDRMQVIRQGTDPETLDATTTYGFVAATDSLGRVQSVWRKLGVADIEQRTAWDSSHAAEPVSVTDNYGATPARTVSYTYVSGSMGLVSVITEPLTGSTNRTTTYTYNANNDATQVIVAGPGGSTTTRYCFTSSGCSTSGTQLTLNSVIENFDVADNGAKGGTNGNEKDVTTDYKYDPCGQLTRETRWNYDASGNLLDSRAIGYTYDANGNQTAVIVNFTGTDPTTCSSSPAAPTDAATNLSSRHEYDTAGNHISSADPRRALGAGLNVDDYVTRFEYDSLNQQAKTTAPRDPDDGTAPKYSTSVYDELGALREATDFGGLVTGSRYDRAGRPVEIYEDPVSAPAAKTSETTYDAAGRVLTSKDRNQVGGDPGSTNFEYDELGRTTKVTEAFDTSSASEATSGYDALDRQTSLTVGGIQTTETAYDLGGRGIEIDDGFTCTQATFDYRDLALTETTGQDSGNPCTDGANKRVLTNSYDGLGRLTETEVTSGIGTGDRTFDVTLDAAGRQLTSAVTTGGVTRTTNFTLNPLDQVIAEARPDGSSAKTNFDPAGNVTDACYWKTGITVGDCFDIDHDPWTNPPTQVTTAAYDARNNRVSLTDSATGTTTTYDPLHNYQIEGFFIQIGSGKEHQTLYEYDPRHRLQAITQQVCVITSDHSCPSPISTTGSDDYSYDDNDNRTMVAESNGATSSTHYYCYDVLNRLQYRTTGTNCSGTTNETYSYDDAGNRLTAPGETFTYDGNGQLTGCTTNCGTVTHDSAGRITRLGSGSSTWVYEYDAEGRLTKACKSTACSTSVDLVEFSYDGEGHRTKIVETTAGGQVTTHDFLYVGDAIVQEKTNTVISREYVVDEAGRVIRFCDPDCTSPTATSYLVSWNGHGDALAAWRINGDGTLTLANSYTYSSWGAPITATHNSVADLGFRFLYVGAYDVQWDNFSGLGLHYMHARHYSPSIGRFLQPDPAAIEGNLYAYASNRPLNCIDPSGLASCDLIAWNAYQFGKYATAAVTLVFARHAALWWWRADWKRAGEFTAGALFSLRFAMIALRQNACAGRWWWEPNYRYSSSWLPRLSAMYAALSSLWANAQRRRFSGGWSGGGGGGSGGGY